MTSRRPRESGPAGTPRATAPSCGKGSRKPSDPGSRAPTWRLTPRAAPPPRARPRPAPPSAARLDQSGRRAPRPAEMGLTSLRVGRQTSGARPPWEWCCVAHARGAFHTGWEQRRSHSPGPSQTSVSEFPPCASAASNVRARPLFSGLASLTFWGLGGEIRRFCRTSVGRVPNPTFTGC